MLRSNEYDFGELKGVNLPAYPVCLFMGSRRAGKSSAMIHLACELAKCPQHKFDAVLTMCGSSDARAGFEMLGVPLFSYDSFDEELITALLNHQEHERDTGGTPQNILMFMDDLGFERLALNKSVPFARLLKNGRHGNVTLFITSHAPKELQPEHRQNVDAIFLPGIYNNNIDELSKLHKMCGGRFPSFAAFANSVRATTVDFRFMVILTNARDALLRNTVFWLQARIDDDNNVKGVRPIGRKSYWAVWKKYRLPPGTVPLPAPRAFAGGPRIRIVGGAGGDSYSSSSSTIHGDAAESSKSARRVERVKRVPREAACARPQVPIVPTASHQGNRPDPKPERKPTDRADDDVMVVSANMPPPGRANMPRMSTNQNESRPRRRTNVDGVPLGVMAPKCPPESFVNVCATGVGSTMLI